MYIYFCSTKSLRKYKHNTRDDNLVWAGECMITEQNLKNNCFIPVRILVLWKSQLNFLLLF